MDLPSGREYNIQYLFLTIKVKKRHQWVSVAAIIKKKKKKPVNEPWELLNIKHKGWIPDPELFSHQVSPGLM